MFTKSSNGSSFYPNYSYPCAGCGACIYSSNLESLSNNHVSLCTACLHGTLPFQQYEVKPDFLSTKCNNDRNSGCLLAHQHQEANPISSFLYGSSSTHANHPPIPTFKPANDEITKQCEDEINSWFLFNHVDVEQNQPSNNALPYANVDHETMDIGNYYAGSQTFEYQQQFNQLQQPYSFQHVCNETESIPSQSMQAVGKHADQLQSLYIGLEDGAFKDGFFQTSSCWGSSATLPPMDAYILPQATTESYRNVGNIPQEVTFGPLLSSCVEVIQPEYCPVTRKAKVLRYRQKRKARKFEKKIRYNSRKANAEKRRRERGRFARRPEVQEPDQTTSTTEKGYAIIQSCCNVIYID